MEGLTVSPLGAEHLELVAGIEERSQLTPMSRGLLAPILAGDSRSRIIGAFDGAGTLAGFLIYSLLPPESELEDLCVDLPFRNLGVGSSLMGAYCAILEEAGCSCSHLEVRISNAPALHLYRKWGYGDVGRRRDYYRLPGGGREDALLMTRSGA